MWKNLGYKGVLDIKNLIKRRPFKRLSYRINNAKCLFNCSVVFSTSIAGTSLLKNNFSNHFETTGSKTID